ncbi:MAG: hypothetical protein K0R69_2302, partial [Clostridia bacterium]|nr:hypothetical protein [Clostridia bacterium]
MTRKTFNKRAIATLLSVTLTLSTTMPFFAAEKQVDLVNESSKVKEIKNNSEKKEMSTVTVSSSDSNTGRGKSSIDSVQQTTDGAYSIGSEEQTTESMYSLEGFINSRYDDYETDRFIVKYRDESGRKKVTSSLGGELKKTKKLKSNKHKNFDVITTKTKMKKSDLLTKIKNKKSDSEIDYIQPDYVMSASAVEPSDARQQATSDITDSFNISNDNNIESDGTDLSEYLKDLPPDDPIVQEWLKQKQVEKVQKEVEKLNKEMYMDEGSEIADIDVTTDKNKGIFPREADINIQATWEKSRGEGAIVAVLDTGVDITHKSLASHMWINSLEIQDNGNDEEGNGYIDDAIGWNFCDDNNEIHNKNELNDEWHGTHIAGIIAQLAPEAKIMPLKVFKNGVAYTSDIIEAIEYAESMGADIANCSFGTNAYNPALKETIEKSNMLFICSVGNSHLDIDKKPIYPASYSISNNNVISVTSIGGENKLSSYSNYGQASVNISAPGENIISSIPGDKYAQSSGTSISAAFISGEAAILIGENKHTNARIVKQAIINSSDKLSALEGQVHEGNKSNFENGVSVFNLINIEVINADINKSFTATDSVYRIDQNCIVTDSIYQINSLTGILCRQAVVTDSIYNIDETYSLLSSENEYIWSAGTSMITPMAS